MTDKSFAIEDIVDLARHPIGGSNRDTDYVKKCGTAFQETGLCALYGFIKPDALKVMVNQAEAVADKAYFCDSEHNAYLEPDNDAFPADHPRRQRHLTTVGSVAYDNIPDQDLLHTLYHWDPLKDFIAGVLGKPKLHRFADPLGACSINVFETGGRHAWHFDESQWTVTLMLQAPEQGGAFEYIKGIRGADDEYDQLGRALDGDRANIVHLPFNPGTLLIFNGNDTLHQVTEASGDRLRLVPVLCFSEKPNAANSEEVRQLFWGRTG